MRHRVVSLLVLSTLPLALSASAEVYTIKLSNGTTFESRYQPKQASWDPTMVTFLGDTGTEIALPQSLVVSVEAQSETKGYGRVIDTTTVDLGIMPNDLDESQRIMQEQAQQMSPFEQALPRYDQQQFVDPNKVGGGIPVGFAAGGYGPGTSFYGGAPAGGFGAGGAGGGGAMGGGGTGLTPRGNAGTPAPSPAAATPGPGGSQQ